MSNQIPALIYLIPALCSQCFRPYLYNHVLARELQCPSFNYCFSCQACLYLYLPDSQDYVLHSKILETCVEPYATSANRQDIEARMQELEAAYAESLCLMPTRKHGVSCQKGEPMVEPQWWGPQRREGNCDYKSLIESLNEVYTVWEEQYEAVPLYYEEDLDATDQNTIL